MPIWVGLFVLLLGSVELSQWVQGLTLPFPAFIAMGMLLAIASNRDKRAGLPWRSPPILGQSPTPPPIIPPIPTNSANPSVSVLPPLSQSASPPPSHPRRSPELPNLSPRSYSHPSISFTIRKPNPKN